MLNLFSHLTLTMLGEIWLLEKTILFPYLSNSLKHKRFLWFPSQFQINTPSHAFYSYYHIRLSITWTIFDWITQFHCFSHFWLINFSLSFSTCDFILLSSRAILNRFTRHVIAFFCQYLWYYWGKFERFFFHCNSIDYLFCYMIISCGTTEKNRYVL